LPAIILPHYITTLITNTPVNIIGHWPLLRVAYSFHIHYWYYYHLLPLHYAILPLTTGHLFITHFIAITHYLHWHYIFIYTFIINILAIFISWDSFQYAITDFSRLAWNIFTPSWDSLYRRIVYRSGMAEPRISLINNITTECIVISELHGSSFIEAITCITMMTRLLIHIIVIDIIIFTLRHYFH